MTPQLDARSPSVVSCRSRWLSQEALGGAVRALCLGTLSDWDWSQPASSPDTLLHRIARMGVSRCVEVTVPKPVVLPGGVVRGSQGSPCLCTGCTEVADQA